MSSSSLFNPSNLSTRLRLCCQCRFISTKSHSRHLYYSLLLVSHLLYIFENAYHKVHAVILLIVFRYPLYFGSHKISLTTLFQCCVANPLRVVRWNFPYFHVEWVTMVAVSTIFKRTRATTSSSNEIQGNGKRGLKCKYEKSGTPEVRQRDREQQVFAEEEHNNDG